MHFYCTAFQQVVFFSDVAVPNTNASLTQTWVYKGILLSNIEFIARNVPSTYGVSHSSVLLKNLIGWVRRQSSLKFTVLLQKCFKQRENHLTFYFGGNRVAFVPTPSGTLLADSHLHGNVGPIVTFPELQKFYELLS